MKAKKAAMLRAEAHAVKANHSLGPWTHKGQTATARCTCAAPLGDYSYDTKRRKKRHLERCGLVVSVHADRNRPPTDTEPEFLGPGVATQRNDDGDMVGISACSIGIAFAVRAQAYHDKA